MVCISLPFHYTEITDTFCASEEKETETRREQPLVGHTSADWGAQTIVRIQSGVARVD